MGLPTEGYRGDDRRIASFARPVPSVTIAANVADVMAVADDAQHPIAVLGCDGVLLGAVQPEAASLPADTPVERIMIPAPATIRPDLRVEEVVARLRKDRLDRIFVTAVNGQLVGLVVVDELHV